MTATHPVTTTEMPREARPRVAHPPTQWQRIEHHSRTLDRAIRITQMADAKVAPVLALHVSLAAVTVTQSSGLGDLLFADAHSRVLAAIGWLLLGLYGIASVVAAFYVTVVYVPTAPRRGAARTHSNSLFYFDDIQALSAEEFERLSVELDIDLAERDVIHQAHCEQDCERQAARRATGLPVQRRHAHRVDAADGHPARLAERGCVCNHNRAWVD